MKVDFLHQLIDYIHGDKPYEVRQYIMEQTAKMKDNNKGYFWEKVLAKKMTKHTSLLGGNAVGRDFSDGTDAKFATFYKRTDGVFEASVSNIRRKVGPLRVCLCVPGQTYHRVYFLFIPYDAYQKYTAGSDALKFTLNSKTSMVSGKLTKYICSFDDVGQPYKELDLG
jgi:hypothetical protein